MPRIQPVDRSTPHPTLRRHFDAVERRLGTVPNMMRTMAVSPTVLEGYLALLGALERGALPASVQERIALSTAQANDCDYCLAAHAALGRLAGLPDAEIDASRTGRSADPKAAAALRFAAAVLERRGDVSAAALADARSAGFTDAEIAEVVAHVALNVFTNYFNRVARTEVDFPRVPARASAA